MRVESISHIFGSSVWMYSVGPAVDVVAVAVSRSRNFYTFQACDYAALNVAF